MEMSDFVVFMVSTFLRASEWTSLQHRHVTVIEDGPTPHISIAAVRGKTGARTVLSMPEAIPAYRRIIARTGGLPDAYLFKGEFLNRQTATEKMRDSFELLLRDTKLKVDALGKKRVIHSLRHSAIMFRILEGDHVDHLVLAKNAGTSIDQIERFYASHLQVSMKLANLQSNKAGRGGRR
jgi:integrase